MGSSAKKKREKAKDFKKAKLKVGKTKAKPDNFTDTSFKSKAIVLATQSLSTDAPTAGHLFTHQISLLTHHSNTTRRESLAFLTTNYPSAASSASVPPISTLLPKLSPLVLDPSPSVRTQLLTLLTRLSELHLSSVQLHLPTLLLHVHSAMTHLDPAIRADSTKFLSWALDVSSEQVFANGGWSKGLRALSGVLAFRSVGGDVMRVVVPAAESRKAVIQHLGVLKEFLEKGLSADGDEEGKREMGVGLCPNAWIHMRPKQPGVYAYLGLFTTSTDASGLERQEEPQDVDSRRRWILKDTGDGKEVVGSLRLGLDGLKKEGGEVGRIAGKVLGVIDDVAPDE